MFTVRLCFWMRGVCQCQHVGTRRAKTVIVCLSASGYDSDWAERLKTTAFKLMSVLVERIHSTSGLQRSPLYYDRGMRRQVGAMCLAVTPSVWLLSLVEGLGVRVDCVRMRQGTMFWYWMSFINPWLYSTATFSNIKCPTFFKIYSLRAATLTLVSLLWLTKTTLSSEQQWGWVLRLSLHHSDKEAP